jgi:hypothetical protein
MMKIEDDPEALAAVRLLKSKGFTVEMFAQELARRGVVEAAPPKGKSCNRHDDCDAAQAKAKEEGKPERFGPGSTRIECCNDDDCDDCLPK